MFDLGFVVVVVIFAGARANIFWRNDRPPREQNNDDNKNIIFIFEPT